MTTPQIENVSKTVQTPKEPPKTTRTMDQIDRKLEAHTFSERKVILAYLNAQWAGPADKTGVQ